MNEINIPQIITTTIAVSGFVFGILKYILGGITTNTNQKLAEIVSNINEKFIGINLKIDSIDKFQKEIVKELNDFKLESVGKYVSRTEYENNDRNNTSSHAVLHGKLDELNQRITVIETVQKQCKSCNN